MNKTVQGLKVRNGINKETQSEGNLEMKIRELEQEPQRASLTNKMQEMGKRISGLKTDRRNEYIRCRIGKISCYKTSRKSGTLDVRIIGIEKGDETKDKGTENIFKKIIEENLPNIKREIPMTV